MTSALLMGLSTETVAVVSPPRSPPDVGNETPVEATNLKTMGSYNWIEHPVPIIAIPGQPTRWKGFTPPIRLNMAISQPSIDHEIARQCGLPLESNLRAIRVTQESLGVRDFDLSKEYIDIVTNRNSLRNLLIFASSGARANRRSAFSHHDSFRIDAQLAPNGRTMVLTRFEKDSRPRSSNSPSYDEAFEYISTEEHSLISATDIDGSRISLRAVGYHRIVRYDLLGMRFLVRSRVDAMVEPGPEHTRASDIDDLANSLSQTHIGSVASSSNGPYPVAQVEGSNLRHIRFGNCVPQEELTDIKTVSRGYVKWNTVYPQFFLSQTPQLKVATRHSESVTQIQTFTQDSLQIQHEQQSGQIRLLVDVLGRMRRVMQDHGRSSPLAFVWNHAGDLKVYRVESPGPYLSDDGLDQF